MTFPDDRVLVGVINRKRDLKILQEEHWYRIPQAQLPNGVYTEYLAFFLSGRVFSKQSGAIHYFAERKGLELARRKDLLPNQPNHKNAENVYYKVQVHNLEPKIPPIENTSKRVISFIFTTWDRFVRARTISDLYSEADYLVDRVYHALRDARMHPTRLWDAEGKETGLAPQLRVLCNDGTELRVSTKADEGEFYLRDNHSGDEILAEIKRAIAAHKGPAYIGIPLH